MRDRAVGTLLVYYGLRRSDVAFLKIESINWEESTISITQQKTEVPLKLPLLPVAGNALFDYLTKERRKSDCPYVFLSLNRPYNAIGVSGINGITDKIFNLACIRMDEGDHRGTHIFRHHFATSFLENNVAQPVISKLMGHLDPKSVETYLSADFTHLQECAVSIEDYPMPVEVFVL